MPASDDLLGRVPLPEGVRWIEKQDTRCEFWTDDPVMAKHELEDYFRWSLEPDSIVIVREVVGPAPIAAVLYATVHPDHLMIEMVARNKHAPYPGSGALLVSALANFVAPALAVHELRLESRPDVVPYWDDVIGFQEYAPKVQDPEFGDLTPKRKRV